MSNDRQEGLLEDPNAGSGAGATGSASAGSTGAAQSVPGSGYTVTSGDQGGSVGSTDRSAVIEGDQGTAGDVRYVTSSTAPAADVSVTDDTATVTTRAATTGSDFVAQPVQAQPAPVQSARVEGQEHLTVELHEEELQAQKVTRQAGEVRVTKEVVEEQRTLEVPVTREQVRVTSVTPTQSAADPTQAFQEGTISVPVREEDVQVTKQVRVAEELEIGKTAVQETQHVTDTVRREQLNVQEVGEVEVERRSERPINEVVRPKE